MRLEKDSLFLVHPTRTIRIGKYKVGDSFKMVRCKTGVLFYKNGSLLEGYTLPNNNFVMVGDVRMSNALLSRATVFFTPYWGGMQRIGNPFYESRNWTYVCFMRRTQKFVGFIEGANSSFNLIKLF